MLVNNKPRRGNEDAVGAIGCLIWIVIGFAIYYSYNHFSISMLKNPIAPKEGEPFKVAHPLQIGIGALCGGLLIGSIVWQFRVWGNCSKSSRARFLTFGIPFYGGVILNSISALGAIAYGAIGYFDPNSGVEFAPLMRFVLIIFCASLAFFFKSCINAIMVGLTATWSLYFLLSYGQFEFVPIFRTTFEVFASGAPDWLQIVYTGLCLSYSAFAAVSCSFDKLYDSIISS